MSGARIGARIEAMIEASVEGRVGESVGARIGTRVGARVGARVLVLVHVVLGEERVFDALGMPCSRRRMKTFGLGEIVATGCRWGMYNHSESRG